MRNRSGRGRTELVDRRLQVTDHNKYGVMGRTASGAQHGEQDIPMRCLKGHAALAATAGGFSVEGGFGEDDTGSTMLTPGHVRGLGRRREFGHGQTSES